MVNPIETADRSSHFEAQIERAAKSVGHGVRLRVFEAIYYHKSKVKTVEQIAAKTKLSRMQVLQAGRSLFQKSIVGQTKKDGDTAYVKIDFFHGHKRQIIDLAKNRKKLDNFSNKRKLVVKLPKTISLPTAGAKVKRLTIDDIESFSKVRKIRAGAMLAPTISEDQFKRGVQAIVGEGAVAKDWGGETSDFYSIRVKMKRKRFAAAFAFKGPGLKAKLVPAKMGKNGDQAIRLFREDADIFLVQHWREIDPTVVTLLQQLAVAKSVATGKTIYYGIIDGQDSERLRSAYANEFMRKAKKPRRA